MADNQSQQDLLRSASNMCKAGAILAGISLLFGGVLLSLVGLICALIGRSKYSKANAAEYLSYEQRQSVQRLLQISLMVALGALLLNGYALYVRWPAIMEFVNSGGDIMSLYASLGGGGVSSGVTGVTSTWG